MAETTGEQRETALRRLAALGAADPALRQGAVDAICALLRTSPAEPAGAGADPGAWREALRALGGLLRPAASAAASASASGEGAGAGAGAGGAAPAAGGAAPEIVVDLSGATLVDADFGGCELAEARFADTRFLGAASFADARFTGEAVFARALFAGEARFDGARFASDAVFGRARFRGPASFERVGFDGMAWFGRGEEEIWEDDPTWEMVEDVHPAAWDEPNEDDPDWPVAVLMGDYQGWSEGGDGARFVGPVSFRQARFAGPAWFFKARFGADAAFTDARFGGPVHLDQPAVDLAGARWGGAADDEPVCWPLGWAPEPGPDGAGALVPDRSAAPYARQLADPDPDVRRAGLAVLGALGDARPELRQRVVDTVCGYLRGPLPFPVTGDLNPGQAGEVELRRGAQRLLAERLRPVDPTPDGAEAGLRHWAGMSLSLCGATLIDFDLSGCHVGYADFMAAQFHGVTRFDASSFEGAVFGLGGPDGRASFHGDVTFAGARLDRWRGARDVLGGVVFHAGVVLDDAEAGDGTPPGQE
ncbi:pentapeptide repeat-containing protein [Micromonospora sp. NBC_01655]|uniref:pentapeptide repeat-containing protein n=1 Tax=Micromonospora sp. NBC_01655 TaxID=2975983 RepID=UPI0022538EF0|nr:pentapeptide repeat-containing protein [Micromonospora sp. NBC_01655]MCX4472822.1 pentapeptide repeat-containing protein [Micromonospora sp. NBC_01655]